ncbi:MAG TPA: thiamine pyrophosphate-dependent enzyme [Spirochaetota bacterium]|nr:thiamine pyrophosphate-dependent enzyme [Spirochaetota bacterium]
MKNRFDFDNEIDIAWCPGCGDFAIRKALLEALEELDLERKNVVLVSGIGQAAKMPQYINTSFFNGLHGRALPAATAIKACNPELTVIAEGGDGDMLGEGGNHLLHCTRRNPDITLFIHENMIYGLTKGQAAPTSRPGMKTPVQVDGVFEKPINPVALAVSLDVPFVARVFCGNHDQTKETMKQAILHRGFAIVDIFQPCVSFNKTNTYAWFKEHTSDLPEDYDPSNRVLALEYAIKEDPFPLGVIYRSESRKPFEDYLRVYQKSKAPLFSRKRTAEEIIAEIDRFR